MRLRRKQVIPERHTEFSPLLFDVLFGLLIFLAVNALFDVRGVQSLFLMLASIAVIVHWWLKYKAADETYGLEVGNSTIDLLFGLIEIVLLQSAVMAAARGEALHAIFYFSLPMLIESVWALIWRFCGTWQRTSRERVKYMEQQLESTIFLNFGAAAAIGALIANAPLLTAAQLVGGFATIYVLYAVLASYWELVDIRLF